MNNFENSKNEIKERVDEGTRLGCAVHNVRKGTKLCGDLYCTDCEKDNLEWLLAEYQEPKEELKNNEWHKLKDNPNDLPAQIRTVCLVKYETEVATDSNGEAIYREFPAVAEYLGRDRWIIELGAYTTGTAPNVVKWKEVDD